MKNKSLLALAMLLVAGCNGQYHDRMRHSSHSSTHSNESTKTEQRKIEDIEFGFVESFPTIGFKTVYKDTISYPVEDVFPLFEPQGRSLLYPNWEPTELRKGKSGTLEGQVLFSKYDELHVMLTVTEYNPGKGHIQYLVVWDDFEIQRIDIYCTNAGTENSTAITWLEYNAGLYEEGVPLVSMFVEEGHLVKVVKRYITNIENQLKHGA